MIRRMSERGPFPGMDPWLQSVWTGVHTSLATYARDQLQAQLGRSLVACLGERVYVTSVLEERRDFAPDVHLYRRPKSPPPSRARGGGPAVAEPELIPIQSLVVREPLVEIRDVESDEKVITAIEFLSPENKKGRIGRRAYLDKQREVIRAGASLVEVDLLRGGRAVTVAARRPVPEASRATYHACAVRAGRTHVVEYYAIPLRERMPKIRVPLRTGDPDAFLDLQAILDETYKKGRYKDRVDYGRRPRPPLELDDAAWANRLVSAWRKRSA